ncbi:MAG: hypothetical protein GY839_20580, partial [candidate division Zixibacteria bacterium]|nr:hypothetical protein [candidate division Zixibacteria bacterium]
DHYEIYRAANENFADSVYVTGIGNNIIVTYTDENLDPNAIYYYRVNVVDTDGAVGYSQIVSGATNANAPPTAVNLISITAPVESSDRLQLSWLANTDFDFAAYEILRSDEPTMTDLVSIAVLSSQNTDQYLDSELEENTTYYYRIDVYDTAEQKTSGNVLDGTTGINQAPEAVTLSEPFDITANSATLNWTTNFDQDFSFYALYRDTTGNVTENSLQIQLISNQLQTTYIDESLTENSTYYYRVYVVDLQGASSGSNIVSMVTTDGFPTAVTLLSVSSPDETSDRLQLYWLGNQDADFETYHILRATNEDMTENLTTAVSIDNQNETDYLDTDLDENTTYYYRIDVYDTGGNSTPGNVLGQTTGINPPPESVVLSDPFEITDQSITLNWTINNDPDFDYYALYRDFNPGVNEQSTQVALIDNHLQTIYIDQPLIENTTYFYRVYVVDQQGAFNGSNEVWATTANGFPTSVVLNPPSAINESGMTLTWLENTDLDFAEYRLYRSTTSGVDSTDQLITA